MRPALLLLVLSGCFGGRIEEAYDRDRDGFPTWELGGPDCDDNNAAVYPGAPEICGNGLDDDCSGFIDHAGVGDAVFYVDQDADGFPGTTPQSSCEVPPGGFLSLAIGADCDDADPTRSPGATEVYYDGVDQDCDGNDTDADGDGWPGGPTGPDCDDTDPQVNPDMREICNNGVDDDCDGGAGPCAMEGVVDAADVVVETFGGGGNLWVSEVRASGSESLVLIDDEEAVVYGPETFPVFGRQRLHRVQVPGFGEAGARFLADVTGDGVLDVVHTNDVTGWFTPGPLLETFYTVSTATSMGPWPAVAPPLSIDAAATSVAPGVVIARTYAGEVVLRHLDAADGWPVDAPEIREWEVIGREMSQLVGVFPVAGADEVVITGDGGVYQVALSSGTVTDWPLPANVLSVDALWRARSNAQGTYAFRAAVRTPTGLEVRLFTGELLTANGLELDGEHAAIGIEVSEAEVLDVVECDIDGDGSAEIAIGIRTPDPMLPWFRDTFGVYVVDDPGSGGRAFADSGVFIERMAANSLACHDLDDAGVPQLIGSDPYVGTSHRVRWSTQ